MEIKDRLLLAETHIKEANTGLADKSLFSGNSSLKPEQWGKGVTFYPMDNGYKSFAVNCHADELAAYMTCPPLSYIIDTMAAQYINGDTWILTRKGKSQGEESTSPAAERLRKLLDDPNHLQSFNEFEVQLYTYLKIFGYSVIYAFDTPTGFDASYAKEIWNINPAFLEINEKPGMFFRHNDNIESIFLTYGGNRMQLNKANVHIIKDSTAPINSMLFPPSRIQKLTTVIDNILGAYGARKELIYTRGAIGMLTNQTADSASFIPLKPGEKDELHKDYNQLYGLMRGQRHVIITSANLKWQSMVTPTKDLMLFEECEKGTIDVANMFKFPPVLLNLGGKGTTFSNEQTATRNLFMTALIPDAKHIYSQLNKIFGCYANNLEIEKDYSKIEALKPDALAAAMTRLRNNQAYQIEFRNNISTKNDWLRANNEDPVPDGDVYYSDIRELLEDPVNVENDNIEDNINPREGEDGEGNDGTPNQQA